MNKKVFTLILIAVALRIILAFGFYGNYDQDSFDIVAAIGRHGGNVYAETDRYNYAPTWSLIITALSYLPIPLHASIPLLLTLVDLAIAYFIFKLTAKTSLALIFLLNPVSILITGFHGQFENLAILPLLIAVYLQKQQKPLWTLFLLCTLSLLIKHITLFFVIALFFHYTNWRRATLFTIGALAIFTASFIPYLPDGFEGIMQNVLSYESIRHPYGFSFLEFWSTPMFIAIMGFVLILLRKLTIPNKLLLISLAFLIFTPGISVQYFVLPIIFGSIVPNIGYYVFFGVTAIFLLGNPDNLNLNIPSIWFSVWGTLVSWAIFEIRMIIKRNNQPQTRAAIAEGSRSRR